MITSCEEAGLVVSRASFSKYLKGLEDNYSIQNHPSPLEWHNIAQALGALVSTMHTELDMQRILLLEGTDVEFYENCELFGDEVPAKFKGISYDIVEAGKCLALDRSTAAVFHLMRITEAGLMRIARRVGVKDRSPSWNDVLNAVNTKVKTLPRRTNAERRKHEFFATISTHMNAVRIAWRNNVMHMEQTYTKDEAINILNATRGLMKYVAENL